MLADMYVSHGRLGGHRTVYAKRFCGVRSCSIAPYFRCSNRIKTEEQYNITH